MLEEGSELRVGSGVVKLSGIEDDDDDDDDDDEGPSSLVIHNASESKYPTLANFGTPNETTLLRDSVGGQNNINGSDAGSSNDPTERLLPRRKRRKGEGEGTVCGCLRKWLYCAIL